MEISKKEDNHINCLNWLIINSEEARQFFCEENIKYKNNLVLLLSEEGILLLELLHPYVLKLDIMQSSARIYLYNFYIQNNNKLSTQVELRIIGTFLFNGFKKIENLEGIGEEDKKLREIIKIKTKWLRTIIFENTYDILTYKSICLLNRFGRIVASLAFRNIFYTSKTKNSHKWNLTLPEFNLWEGKDCDNLEDQKFELELIKKEIEESHVDFLITKNNIKEIAYEQLGNRCKINKLFTNKFRIYDKNVFNNFIRQINHLIDSLNDYLEDFKYLNKIASNYFIWYNWVNNKLNKCKSEECKQLLTIWELEINKAKITNYYDCIFNIYNDNEEEEENILKKLKNIEDLLFKKQFKIKSFILNLFKKQNKNNNKEKLNKLVEWEYLLNNYENNENDEWINKYWNNKAINEHKRWIQELNLKWLLEIFDKNNKTKYSEEEAEKIENLKLIIKKELKSEDFQNSPLQLMIGNKTEDLEEISKSLGLEFKIKKQNNIENNNDIQNNNIIIEKEEKEEENNNLNNSEKLKNKKIKKQNKIKNNEKNNKIKKSKNKSKIKSSNKNYANLYKKLKSKIILPQDFEINEENKDKNSSSSSSTSKTESLNSEKDQIIDKISQTSLETEIKINEEEESQTTKSELLEEEECSTSSNNFENNSFKKENNNKLIIPKENNFNQNYLINNKQKGNLEINKNYMKINNNNSNGEINQQKYFDNNDWILYEALINNNNKNNNNKLTEEYSPEIAIDNIKEVINKMNIIGKLLISGSYLLNVRTIESDIDCILTIPSQLENANDLENIHKEQFFGNFNCNIDKRICEDNSLYCLLCKDLRTRYIRKTHGRVSIINVDFFGQQFDLILVVLPINIFNELNNEINNNLSVKIVDKIIANFIEAVGGYSIFNEKYIHLGMLLALSGYRANLRILELINKNEKNFQLTLLAIKIWAKNNFIYGNLFGFLSGTSIAVLACRFILLNPNASIIILIKSIFEYFAFYKIINIDGTINSIPIILEFNIDYQNIRKYLDWNYQNEYENRLKLIPSIFHIILEKHLYPIWPIITSGFPTQNANFNMNLSTAKIIQQTMIFGLQKLNIIENTMENIKNEKAELTNLNEEWQNWLNGDLFKNKYNNYLAIICSYSPKSNYGNSFCDFVSTRIRLQLLFSIEILEDIEYCHLNPKKALNNQKCLTELKSEKMGEDWFCNIWLVGIMFKKLNFQQIPSLEKSEGAEKLLEFSQRIINGKQVLMSEWAGEISLFNLNVKYLKWKDVSILF